MLLDISNLLKGSIGQTETVEFEDNLSGITDIVLTSPARGRVELTKLDNSILAQFDITLAANSECSRCLDPLVEKLDLNFRAEYSLNIGEDLPEEAKYFVHKGKIDVTEPIRQEALSSFDLNAICRSACKGLCPNCGVNWNREKCDCKIETNKLDRIKDRI